MTAHTRRLLAAGLTTMLTLGLAAAAARPVTAQVGTGSSGDTGVASAFRSLDRTTAWTLTGRLRLAFPTFHTEGLAVTGDRIFLSAVEILEPTVKYPTPQNGYDRTPGKGVGHLFVMDRQGNLQQDIVLGEGDMYHPGGIDVDGRNVWVPVAQYRPNSSAIIYRVDVNTLQVHRQFEVPDHIGGIVLDKTTGHLVGNT